MSVENPFDHSDCNDHGPAVWPIRVSESIEVDMLQVFERLWDYIAEGQLVLALTVLDAVGYLMTQAALGRTDELERDYVRFMDRKQMSQEARAVDWDEELRRLLGGD